MLWCFTVAVAGGLVGLVLGNIRLPVHAAHRLQRGGRHRAPTCSSRAAAAGDGGDRPHPRRAHQLAAVRVDGAAVDRGRDPRRLPVGRAAARGAARRHRRRAALQLASTSRAGRRRRAGPTTAASPTSTSRRPSARARSSGCSAAIVGLILGSLRMPALLKIVGERPARVAGTNLAVGFWVGVFGAIGHLPVRAAGLEGRRARRRRVDPGRAHRRAAHRAPVGAPARARHRRRAAGGGDRHGARRPCRSLGAMADDLERETTELLQRLVRFNTVNPPGNERAAQEQLAGVLRRRGLRGRAAGTHRGAARTSSRACAARGDGPTLCLLSPRRHRARRRRPSGSATHGRATSSTASSGAAARRT